MKKKNIELFIAIIIVLLFSLFFAYDGINSIKYNFLTYDEAYNATVSFNMFKYGKYMISYPGFYLFHNYITTGPLVLLPTALLFKLFGVSNTACRLIPLLFGICDIALIFIIFSLLFKKIKYRYIVSSIITILLCLSNSLFYQISTSLLGESSALFFVLLSLLFLLIYNNTSRTKYIFLSGGVLSLALLTKISTIFIVATLFTLLLYERILKNIKTKQLLYFLVGFICLFVIHELFKLYQYGNLIDYFKYWINEFKYMLLQSSGSKEYVSITTKFNYFYDIFENNKFVSLIMCISPCILYLIIKKNTLFKKDLSFLKKDKNMMSMILFGISGASLILFFLVFATNDLMYARRHIINTLLVEIFFIYLVIILINYWYKKKKSIMCTITLLVIFVLLFPIKSLANNIINLKNKERDYDVRYVYLNEMYKTIDSLGKDAVIYTIDWWQEPNVTLKYKNSIIMKNILDLPLDYQFKSNEYLMVGALIDNYRKKDIEEKYNVTFTRINQNTIDYDSFTYEFNRNEFDLFSIYRINNN